MKNKEEVQREIKQATRLMERMAAVDDIEKRTGRPAVIYTTISKLLQDLYQTIERKKLMELSDGWEYRIVVTPDSVVLRLVCATDFYTLISLPAHQLTLDEFGKRHEVAGNTVRQWIRRGKIPTAVKYGTDWRIPELSYVVDEDLKVYKRSDGVTIRIYKGFEGESRAENWLVDYDLGDKNLKQEVLTAKEKEKLELSLISDPEVRIEDIGSFPSDDWLDWMNEDEKEKWKKEEGKKEEVIETEKKPTQPTPRTKPIQNKRKKYTMQMAQVRMQEDAEEFFKKYNIPYDKYERGDNKGKLRVKTIRDVDSKKVRNAMNALQAYGYGEYVEHSNCFRDDEDQTIITFSPYERLWDAAGGEEVKVPGYEVTVEKLSIYGMGTQTLVMREIR